jgi:hypothetical protein
MPTLSASDYTTYLKFKAAAASPIQPAIQTRSNATLSQSVLNANILASQAAFVASPTTTKTFAFTATVTTALRNILSGAVGLSGTITYTSSQPHGLSNGDIVTITGFTGFTAANVTTKAVTVTADDTFTVTQAGNGTATGTGSITGRVYYTTSIAHGLVVGDIISISGLSTFDVSGATVFAVPSSTTFSLASSTPGDAETDASGVLTGSRSVQAVSVSGLARVRPVQPETTNNPKALSTLSGSGTMSSSAIQRQGGLPTGFRGSQNSYHRIPQNAGWIQGNMISSGPKRF